MYWKSRGSKGRRLSSDKSDAMCECVCVYPPQLLNGEWSKKATTKEGR